MVKTKTRYLNWKDFFSNDVEWNQAKGMSIEPGRLLTRIEFLRKYGSESYSSSIYADYVKRFNAENKNSNQVELELFEHTGAGK